MFWKFSLAFVLTNLWSYFGKEFRDLPLCCGCFFHTEILALELLSWSAQRKVKPSLCPTNHFMNVFGGVAPANEGVEEQRDSEF